MTLEETLVWCRPVVVVLVLELVKISTWVGEQEVSSVLTDEDVARVVS